MHDYFSLAFFEELAKTLNGDAEFQTKTASVTVTVLMVEKDLDRSFLLSINKGTAAVAEGSHETKADFTFIGDTATWVANHKGEAPMEKLVMTGKLKFKGSIPKIMGLRSQLTVIDKIAQSIPVKLP